MSSERDKKAKTAMDRRAFLNSLNRGTLATSALAGSFTKAWAAKDEGASAPATVDTTAGKIRGAQQGKVYSFKGVPYGAPTGGKMRFLPAGKPEPWTGVKDALEYGHRCPQPPEHLVPEWGAMNMETMPGADCLVLNIWTTGLKDGHKRPVMVFLHGGGFVNGHGNFTCYDGTNLAGKHDVVAITLNHRLNLFGFLYLAEIGGSQFANASNAGMLDIVLALEWVRDNIASFGGDPANVTIFGQSGGGGKVSTLMAMPGAKGLFHRAIVESASAIKGIPRAEANKVAETVLQRVNLTPDRAAELQMLPAAQLLEVLMPGAAGTPGLRLGPVVDGRTLPTDPFDPVGPELSANIPLIIGANETETTFLQNTKYDELDDAALHDRVKQNLRTDDATADRVIAVYKKSRPKASNLDLYLILASANSNFKMGPDLEADRKAAQAKAPVYKYYFRWYTPVNQGHVRAMHTMELPFVFDNVEIAKAEVGTGPDLQPLADKISGAWVAFARTGNPSHKGLPKWTPYDMNRRATMVFNNQCKLVDDPYKEERLALEAARAGRA